MEGRCCWGERVKQGEWGIEESVSCTHLKVVGRGDELLHLLAGEDIGGGEVALGVTVLAGLGGGHVDHLRESSKQSGFAAGEGAGSRRQWKGGKKSHCK